MGAHPSPRPTAGSPPLAPTLDAARAVVLEHGWNTTSFQVLGPGIARSLDARTGALVGYVDTGSAWVAAGAPIVAPDQLAGAADAFVAEARRRGRSACFFAVEARFLEATGLASMAIGEQPVWAPAGWGDILRRTPSLREQLRRARAKGVRVTALPPASEQAAEPAATGAVERLVTRWLAGRRMAPMRFLVDVAPLRETRDRLVLSAHREGALVGLLVAVPIPARRGWLIEHVLRDPELAPNGTSEALIDAAMREAAARGAERITMGLAPLAGAVPAPLRLARRAGGALYDFEGLHAFKAKLRPDVWEPVHLAMPPGMSAWAATVETLRAFAGGGLATFGARTVAHHARSVAAR